MKTQKQTNKQRINRKLKHWRRKEISLTSVKWFSFPMCMLCHRARAQHTKIIVITLKKKKRNTKQNSQIWQCGSIILLFKITRGFQLNITCTCGKKIKEKGEGWGERDGQGLVCAWLQSLCLGLFPYKPKEDQELRISLQRSLTSLDLGKIHARRWR